MEQQLKDIVSHFAIEGEVRDIHPLGNGLINTTYAVETEATAQTMCCKTSMWPSSPTSIC